MDAVEPEECDVSEGLSRRCPDVVRLTSSGVVWIGARPGGPKLVASRLEAELVNLHRRVLTGGRRGSLVAELTMTGADLDGSLRDLFDDALLNDAYALAATLPDPDAAPAEDDTAELKKVRKRVKKFALWRDADKKPKRPRDDSSSGTAPPAKKAKA